MIDIEKVTKHDVIAFLTSIAEKVGPEAKFLHQGMTSSDVLDTCFNIQLQRSGKILLDDLDQLLKTLKQKAIQHKKTICMGRSHGIHAEPVTFGLKLATYYEEFKRNKKRLEGLGKFQHVQFQEQLELLHILAQSRTIRFKKIKFN